MIFAPSVPVSRFHPTLARPLFFLLAAVMLVGGVSHARPGHASEPPPESAVQVRETTIEIPTYAVGPPDPNPMFYTHESYQGAQKRIYPYPLLDHLTHHRQNKSYRALCLENEYVRLIVLPELGGRLFAATDKTNHYDFFYRQHVIKPALIGMLGAWISGGVEWCAFHHHRNTTFMPVDYTLTDGPDGGKTIWIGETERRHRMKWIIGLTLRPGRSYIEASVKFFNRTPIPHSVLYWANVAVHVDDTYQVFFPPSVQVATYHSKIDFTHWPVSQETYRGYDYTGVDISWWKNSPVSNSFFAWNLQEDFMGGYDHGRQAGVVHVADHHIVCGAKLWEWGTGPRGRMWDKILTDEDGPYAEIMVGAFSDNQPDYSWIKPYEVKRFKQYWYPVRAIGGLKNANLHGAVNLQLGSDDVATLGLHATSRHEHARAILTAGGKVLCQQTIDIDPGRPFRRQVEVPAGTRETDLRVSLVSADGQPLVAYQPVGRPSVTRLPQPVKPPPAPRAVKTIEQLYLTGLRVQQIHNPSVDPLDYYREALRRDPGDSRSNLMLAINSNQRGMYDQAEKYLRRSIERITAGYTRPENAEAYFQLGIALRGQGNSAAAYDSFYRATWDYAMHAAAYEQLAELSCKQADYARALQQINRSLATNARCPKARNLKAAILRKLGRQQQAAEVASSVLADDPLNFLSRNELILAQSGRNQAGSEPEPTLEDLEKMMRGQVQAYLELASDYMGCGMWDEAIEVLRRPVQNHTPFACTYPLVHYYLGYLYQQKGDQEQARRCYEQAAAMPTDLCFPFRLEGIDVLSAATEANPSDARAYYYLGNLLFDLQPERATVCWEKSRALDDTLATVHRNLGWVYYRIDKDVPKAIASYEQAVACNQLDPRLFLELDSLYELGNVSPQRRLATIEKHHAIVAQRQDSLLREIMVLVLTGKYDKAIGYLTDNYFHAREGSEAVHDVYVDAHLLRGLALMHQGKAADAMRHFQNASEYPENLSVGRPKNDPRAPQVAYCMGQVHEMLGKPQDAERAYRRAVAEQGVSRSPQARFYQALSWGKLGQQERAARTFDDLVRIGEQGLTQADSADFFAKFGGRMTKTARMASAHFTLALGRLGQGRTDEAKDQLQQAVKLSRSNVWARYQLAAVRGR